MSMIHKMKLMRDVCLWLCLSLSPSIYSPLSHTHTHTHGWDSEVGLCESSIYQENIPGRIVPHQGLQIHVLYLFVVSLSDSVGM